MLNWIELNRIELNWIWLISLQKKNTNTLIAKWMKTHRPFTRKMKQWIKILENVQPHNNQMQIRSFLLVKWAQTFWMILSANEDMIRPTFLYTGKLVGIAFLDVLQNIFFSFDAILYFLWTYDAESIWNSGKVLCTVLELDSGDYRAIV